MKRWFKLGISLIVAFSFLGQAVYANGKEYSYIVALDGQTIAFRSAPVKVDDTLRVNAEDLFAADGLSWSVKDNYLSADREGLMIRLVIGSKLASSNGRSVTLTEGIRRMNNAYMITLEDFIKLTDKQLATNAGGNKFFLKSHLKDRIIALLSNKAHTITYEGERSGNKKQGQGRLYVNGLLLYEGQFTSDAMNGAGKLYLDGQLVYAGGFSNNAPHGAGVYHLSTGERYEGEMKDGRMHGVGKLYRGDRLLYEGDWQQDRMHGVGKVYNAQGVKIYEGELRDNIRHGYGIAYNSANEVKTYQGGWVNGLREGHGLIFNEEGVLEAFGSFKEDAMNGIGTKVTFGTMDWYSGEGVNRKIVKKETARMERGLFVDGMMVSTTDKLIYTTIGAMNENNANADTSLLAFDSNKVPNGIGLLYRFTHHSATPDGVLLGNDLIYQGEMKDGLRHGQGKAYLDGQLVYDGSYENDKRHGTGKAYENGLLVYDGEWRNDNRNGRGRIFEYFADLSNYTGRNQVIIREAVFLADKQRSISSSYKYDGSLENGRLTGTGSLYTIPAEGTFASTGPLAYTGDFQDGRFHGTGSLFQSGSMVYRGEFKDHKRHGHGVEYANGVRVYEGSFADDLREGLGKTYRSGWTLEYEGSFKKGLRDGYGELRENGVIVYKGNFKEGKKHGYGILYRSGSILYEGEFIQDARADGK